MSKMPTHEELNQRVKELEKELSRRKTVEKAIRESEERYSQIIQRTPIPIFVIDNNHIITHCNSAFENLTGIYADKIIGTNKQWQAFYVEERPVMADLIVDNAPEEEITKYYGGNYRKSAVIEGAYEAEGLFENLNDKVRWLFFTASPLKDADGNTTGAIETLQDVTERKRAEEALKLSEKHLRLLLNFVPYPIVVFTLDGRVYYLNLAFTKTFGWSLEELRGKTIPYLPPGFEQETGEIIKKLFEEKIVLRHETRRLTKSGRTLDVVLRAAVYTEAKGEPAGELVLLRNITREKRIARNNEAMLRISMALPEYPDLEELLDYISSEIKLLLNTEGALVILLDEMKEELFFLGAAYDDTATEKKIKEIRFPANKSVAGKVIKTGEPVIIHDTSVDPDFYPGVDEKLGYRTRNLIEVPLRSSDRVIGVLCARNKKDGAFDQTDVELLNMIAGTVALFIENARFSKELKGAYREVTSLNKAKDKVINHLSHELKTPVSVLAGSLKVLARKLGPLSEDTWMPTMERADRNLDRIMDIQNEAEDIMQARHYKTYDVLSLILDQCSDELETLIAEEVGEINVIKHVRKRIEEIFGPKDLVSKEIVLDEFVREGLENLRPSYRHRDVEIITRLEPTPPIFIPIDSLQKMVDGLVKNAVENTPDEGKIEVIVRKKEEGAELVVHDYGVGIRKDSQRRIFEGFFATQDAMAYSSKMPFDFNAGGKGADLLRMKIFSERYNFKIDMMSSRCKFVPGEVDICPGRISKCGYCRNKEDCYNSGETTFSVYFPPASK